MINILDIWIYIISLLVIILSGGLVFHLFYLIRIIKSSKHMRSLLEDIRFELVRVGDLNQPI
jgi:hypothetical protein